MSASSSRKNPRRFPANPIEILSTFAAGALLIWAIQPLRTEQPPPQEGYRPVLGSTKLDATLSGRALASGASPVTAPYATLEVDCANGAPITTPAGTAKVRFSGACNVQSITQKDSSGTVTRALAHFPAGTRFTSIYVPLTQPETTFEFELAGENNKPMKFTRKVLR